MYSGADNIRAIERETDVFASNLLMPGDLLRDEIPDCVCAIPFPSLRDQEAPASSQDRRTKR